MALVVAIGRISVNYLDTSTEVGLLETETPITGQDMGNIDNDVLGLVRTGERVLIEPGPLGGCQLHGDTGAQEGLVVADRGYISLGSRIIVVGQRIHNIPEDGHLGDDAILGGASRAALMEQAESCKIAIRIIARIGIGAIIQIRS